MSYPTLKYLLVFVGILLLAINIVGLLIPLRSPAITAEYSDFARTSTLTFDEALIALENLANSHADKSNYITEATRIFHYGMAHIPPEDIEKNGLDYYRMRVPIWENYILYFLSYLKPSTYRDYEFCNHKKALERGTGRCGQQSLALVSFLSSHGIDTGFINLGGHAIATAKTDNEVWYMLDPDYGGVVPFELTKAEKNPRSVVPYYWNSSIVDRKMFPLFSPEDNAVQYGGPEARYPRACHIETASYIAKWAIPIAFIFIWLALNLKLIYLHVKKTALT